MGRPARIFPRHCPTWMPTRVGQRRPRRAMVAERSSDASGRKVAPLETCPPRSCRAPKLPQNCPKVAPADCGHFCPLWSRLGVDSNPTSPTSTNLGRFGAQICPRFGQHRTRRQLRTSGMPTIQTHMPRSKSCVFVVLRRTPALSNRGLREPRFSPDSVQAGRVGPHVRRCCVEVGLPLANSVLHWSSFIKTLDQHSSNSVYMMPKC